MGVGPGFDASPMRSPLSGVRRRFGGSRLRYFLALWDFLFLCCSFFVFGLFMSFWGFWLFGVSSCVLFFNCDIFRGFTIDAGFLEGS